MSKKTFTSQDLYKQKHSFDRDYSLRIHEQNHYSKLNKIYEQSKSVKSFQTAKQSVTREQAPSQITQTDMVDDPYTGPNTIEYDEDNYPTHSDILFKANEQLKIFGGQGVPILTLQKQREMLNDSSMRKRLEAANTIFQKNQQIHQRLNQIDQQYERKIQKQKSQTTMKQLQKKSKFPSYRKEFKTEQKNGEQSHTILEEMAESEQDGQKYSKIRRNNALASSVNVAEFDKNETNRYPLTSNLDVSNYKQAQNSYEASSVNMSPKKAHLYGLSKLPDINRTSHKNDYQSRSKSTMVRYPQTRLNKSVMDNYLSKDSGVIDISNLNEAEKQIYLLQQIRLRNRLREQDELFGKNLNFHNRLSSTKSSLPSQVQMQDEFKKAGSYRKIFSKYENAPDNFKKKNSYQNSSRISSERIVDGDLANLDSSIQIQETDHQYGEVEIDESTLYPESAEIETQGNKRVVAKNKIQLLMDKQKKIMINCKKKQYAPAVEYKLEDPKDGSGQKVISRSVMNQYDSQENLKSTVLDRSDRDLKRIFPNIYIQDKESSALQNSFTGVKKSYTAMRVSSDVLRNKKSQEALQQFQFKTQEVLHAKSKLAQIRVSKKLESRYQISDNKVYENIDVTEKNQIDTWRGSSQIVSPKVQFQNKAKHTKKDQKASRSVNSVVSQKKMQIIANQFQSEPMLEDQDTTDENQMSDYISMSQQKSIRQSQNQVQSKVQLKKNPPQSISLKSNRKLINSVKKSPVSQSSVVIIPKSQDKISAPQSTVTSLTIEAPVAEKPLTHLFAESNKSAKKVETTDQGMNTRGVIIITEETSEQTSYISQSEVKDMLDQSESLDQFTGVLKRRQTQMERKMTRQLTQMSDIKEQEDSEQQNQLSKLILQRMRTSTEQSKGHQIGVTK